MPMDPAGHPGLHIASIDHVQLAMPAGGEDEARRFYGDVLGLREVPKPPGLADRGGCWFTSADGRVHVHLGIDPGFRAATRAHPAFLVRDLETARRQLREVDASVIEDDSIDVNRCYTTDPFGNRIELVAVGDAGFTTRGARRGAEP